LEALHAYKEKLDKLLISGCSTFEEQKKNGEPVKGRELEAQ